MQRLLIILLGILLIGGWSSSVYAENKYGIPQKKEQKRKQSKKVYIYESTTEQYWEYSGADNQGRLKRVTKRKQKSNFKPRQRQRRCD
jgi:hypothetical protein